MSNKFDEKKSVEIDDLIPENLQELYECEYDYEIDNLVICDHCDTIIDTDEIESGTREVDGYEDYWDYSSGSPKQRSVSYEEAYTACPVCGYGEDEDEHFDYCELYVSNLFEDEDIKGLEDYTGSAFVEALKQFNAKLKEEDNMEKKIESKMNLQEATIKALYDGLKDDTKINDVEGLVDDVLVVTDPEITTDEYNEVIDRAQEIVEDTPKGDIPLDPTYLGEYVQICPICGGTFVEDHILEPGTACPICYETPEAFVMIGKLETEEDVAQDNGLEDTEEPVDGEPKLDLDTMPVDELGNEVSNPETSQSDEEVPEEIAEPVEQPERPNRVRGARQRRNREVASKQLPSGNVLTESKDKTPIEDLIYDLEGKQTEIYTDIEDMEGSEDYRKGFEEGWYSAFDMAIEIVKENYDFHSSLKDYKTSK